MILAIGLERRLFDILAATVNDDEIAVELAEQIVAELRSIDADAVDDLEAAAAPGGIPVRL
jgi:hypothetical protein